MRLVEIVVLSFADLSYLSPVVVVAPLIHEFLLHDIVDPGIWIDPALGEYKHPIEEVIVDGEVQVVSDVVAIANVKLVEGTIVIDRSGEARNLHLVIYT